MAKLMFIHHSGLVGGAGVSLINTIKAVAEENEIIVCVPSQPEDMYYMLKKMEEQYNIRIEKYGRRIGAITYYSGGDGSFSLRLWYRLWLIICQWRYWNKIIGEYNPDKVIVNSKILCWMGYLRSVKSRKSICFVRETMKGKKRNLINQVISNSLDRFSSVIFLSAYDEKKEQLKKAFTNVIHNYVEESQFSTSITREEASKQLQLDENKFHVLYVGGVSHMKGFDLCIQAVLNLDAQIELVVAGSTFEDARLSKNKKVLQYIDTWQTFIQKNDLHHQIHLVVKQRDMSMCYSACDVLVFPMRAPHQSRPAFEAGFFKKPIIISRFENIDEFIKDGENGFRISPDNTKELAEKIQILSKNHELCEKMGLSNWRNTQTLHNQAVNCGKIKEILEK